MKKRNYCKFPYIVFFLVVSNLFAQTEQKLLHVESVLDYSENIFISGINSKGLQLNSYNKIFVPKIESATEVMDSVIVHRADSTQEKHYFNYDVDGNVDSKLLKFWDTNNWSNIFKYSFDYDSNKNRTGWLIEKWEENSWIKSYRYIYQYNSSNNMISDLFQKWVDSSWVNRKQFIYAFNSNLNKTSTIYSIWDGDSWEETINVIYKYDVNGNMVSETHQNWTELRWNNQHNDLYKYDENGNVTEKLIQEWNEFIPNWQDFEKNTFIYDSNNNLTNWLIDYLWDGSNWDKTGRYTYTYDSNNNRLTELYEYAEYSTTWIKWAKYAYIYNSNNHLVSGKFETIKEGKWVIDIHDGDFSIEFNSFTYSFRGATIEVLYKSITDVEDKSSKNKEYYLSQNYPNPFNPSTTISYALPQSGFVQLKVYDMLGREVASLVNKEQASGNYNIEFDASNLTSGVYFYRLQSGNFVESRKMLLLK